jgi:hypothetical protein
MRRLYYLDCVKLKPGDIFHERGIGAVEVIKSPRVKYCSALKKAQVRWKGKLLRDGTFSDFLVTEDSEHYGPTIFK